MKRAISLALLTLATAPAFAAEISVPEKIAFSESAGVRDAIRKECDLESMVSKKIIDASGGRIGTDKAGKELDAKITGVWAAPGPWGAASILVEGTLKEGGKVIGTVASRRNTTRGGGACGKLHVSAEAVAKDIAEWTKSPAMDSKLGDAK